MCEGYAWSHQLDLFSFTVNASVAVVPGCPWGAVLNESHVKVEHYVHDQSAHGSWGVDVRLCSEALSPVLVALLLLILGTLFLFRLSLRAFVRKTDRRGEAPKHLSQVFLTEHDRMEQEVLEHDLMKEKVKLLSESSDQKQMTEMDVQNKYEVMGLGEGSVEQELHPVTDDKRLFVEYIFQEHAAQKKLFWSHRERT